MKDDNSSALVHCSVIIYCKFQTSKSKPARFVWSDKSCDKLKASWLLSTDLVPIIDCEKSMENMEPELIIFLTLYTFKTA